VDIACGTATASAKALKGTRIGRYIGIDISLVEAIRAWDEPADVLWIGQSLHHLRFREKQDFMLRVREVLPSDGLFLIWEATCFDGEDRWDWIEKVPANAPGMANADG
jgi:hypothetical protein